MEKRAIAKRGDEEDRHSISSVLFYVARSGTSGLPVMAEEERIARRSHCLDDGSLLKLLGRIACYARASASAKRTVTGGR